jgi:hypothetical protein
MRIDPKKSDPEQAEKHGCLKCCLWTCLLFGIGMVVLFVLLIVHLNREWQVNQKNQQLFKSLRAGTNIEDIQSIEISGLQKHFVISDRESIRFFTKGFSKLDDHTAKGTRINYCDVRIQFSNGECKNLLIAPYVDTAGMEVCFISFDCLGTGYDEYYDVTFSEDSPPKIKEIFDVLIEAWNKRKPKADSLPHT